MNYLVPWVLFAFIGTQITDIDFTFWNDVYSLFIFYFYWMVLSRIGSLLVGKFFKKYVFDDYSSYSDYISAEKNDEKLPILSETNSTYRTMIATIFVLILLYVAVNCFQVNLWVYPELVPIVLVLLLILFSFSYNKQTWFIVDRVKKSK